MAGEIPTLRCSTASGGGVVTHSSGRLPLSLLEPRAKICKFLINLAAWSKQLLLQHTGCFLEWSLKKTPTRILQWTWSSWQWHFPCMFVGLKCTFSANQWPRVQKHYISGHFRALFRTKCHQTEGTFPKSPTKLVFWANKVLRRICSQNKSFSDSCFVFFAGFF